MGGRNQRNCKYCRRLFRPDPRNRRHQQYCSEAACRAASKAASQARWRSKPENQDYFRGQAAVHRVRAWRSQHPGYWRKGAPGGAPETHCYRVKSKTCSVQTSCNAESPLQDVLAAQPAVLIGLIAHLTGGPLQDDITVAAGRLLRLGNEILAASGSPALVALQATSGSRGPPQMESGGGGGRDRLRDVL
jgi:hypothetical protein